MNVRMKATLCLAVLPWALGACPRIPSEPPSPQRVDAGCLFDSIGDAAAAAGQWFDLPSGPPERADGINDALDDLIEDVRRCAGAAADAGAGN